MAPKPKKMITLITTCTSCGASEEKAKAAVVKPEDIKRIVTSYDKMGVTWLCGDCGAVSKPTSAWDDTEKAAVEL